MARESDQNLPTENKNCFAIYNIPTTGFDILPECGSIRPIAISDCPLQTILLAGVRERDFMQLRRAMDGGETT